MRLTIAILGVEVFDISIGSDVADCYEAEADELGVEITPDRRGDALSTPTGFAPTPHPGWERSLNGYDEPGEGDEDT